MEHFFVFFFKSLSCIANQAIQILMYLAYNVNPISIGLFDFLFDNFSGIQGQ